MADNMTELPDGKLVCTPHQLVICGKCCVDYSFMEEREDPGDGEQDEKEDREEDDQEDKEVEEKSKLAPCSIGKAKRGNRKNSRDATRTKHHP